MAEEHTQTPETVSLEGGSYEIIRGRLQRQAEALTTRLQQLNTARKAVFGSVEHKLISNDRINTKNNCIARDMFAIGRHCLFGYNVHIGLRAGIKLEDVFSVYTFSDNSFHEAGLSMLDDAQFLMDFQNLYRYYKETTFSKFAEIGTYLYMVFQVTSKPGDIKVFKWLIKDGQLKYIDNRSEHEFKFPDQYQFEWKRATRDMHRTGKHPHISILDRVFVETVGGDLTIKVEDNTEDGHGIYAESVEDNDQTLDDAEYYFADLGNLIALKIKPYQEEFRYFIFNEKMQEVKRIDALEDSGVLLPDEHGLIFSNGYYLQTGDYKIFDQNRRNKKFERRIQSPNGEDHLYIFYNAEHGRYVLMSYNVIEQTVATPIVCHGFTLFPDGELVYFKSEAEATRHHVVQIWQTPYMQGELLPSTHTDTYLYKIGNKDIVRAMAECNELLTLMRKDDSYAGLYVDLMKKASDIKDAYYWLTHEEAFVLDESLGEIRAAAHAAIEEFEKVQRLKKSTREAIAEVETKAEALFQQIHRSTFESVDIFVQTLADLRVLRGEIISLRELRYTNASLIEHLEQRTITHTDELAQACVSFLLQEDALTPYYDKIEAVRQQIEEIETAVAAKALEEAIEAIGKELELLIDIVSNLKIEDTTQTTRIIDSISDMYTSLNQIRAAIKRKQKSLLGKEAIAEFGAQIKLLDQGIINYLDLSDSPAKCDEYLTKLIVQLEELESRFAEFDEFIGEITEKREEIYNAFETRKLNLIEARNKRANSLKNAASRILNGIKNRVQNFKEVPQINGFFASDLMIEKVRSIIEQLRDLEDNVKADDIQSQLKSLREDAIRQLRDKQDLFVQGDNVITLGRHHFSVNTQPLDLTLIRRADAMYYHLSGTNFFERVEDTRFLRTQSVWEMSLVSENEQVYRGEFLAYRVLQALDAERKTIPSDELPAFVTQFAANRYHEGYAKGVHDQDAARILEQLIRLKREVDLLYFSPEARACAQLYWQVFMDKEVQALYTKQLQSAGEILRFFPSTQEFDYLIEDLKQTLTRFCTETRLFVPTIAEEAARYLFQEIARQSPFIISKEARDLYQAFNQYLQTQHAEQSFRNSIKRLQAQRQAQFQLVRKWLQAYLELQPQSNQTLYVQEASVLLLLNDYQESRVIDVPTRVEIEGMQGAHARIQEGGLYVLDFNEFVPRLEHYIREVVPLFEQFIQLKKEQTDTFRKQLRLEEFKPRVLSSFVRNKLIDSLYLPIFGDNLAKQIGTVGENTRTDRMGMLLLISPPGYGKTTLMEYIASRLGLIFMKINGPAIGHHVTSLDPSDAGNAAARKELEKLNLALEMGDNIMLYLDDIQHCNPEFLQKFISLTDGQRKIEGVYKGETKTYDLRGKKVCVVMAGNPYTESGDKFQVPDMLANRADIYNLGDIIGDTKAEFELSYIENALTSNPVLQKLAAKSMKDIHTLVRYAETDSREGLTFEGNHSPEELNEYLQVMKKMLRVRDAILKVNLEYIASAAQEDSYRTEPAFKLQGSYRNMNKLAEKIVPIMNDKELETLLLAHYEGEAQTLTSGAEANMLKFKKMNGFITPEEEVRWAEIVRAFQKDNMLRGLNESDPLVQVVAQLSAFTEGLNDIKKVLEQGIAQAPAAPTSTAKVKFK